VDYIKVDQKSKMLVTELEVGEELSLVDGRNKVHGFDFNDYATFHENVQPESKVEPYAVVDHR
jgi:hypothetical protein